MSRRLAVAALAVLAGCSDPADAPYSDAEIAMCAGDLHLRVGAVPLQLPVAALDRYQLAGREVDIARHGRGDWSGDLDRLRAAPAPSLEAITIAIGPYGASESDRSADRLCPRLTRRWARSLCTDPWAPLAQALPPRFSLVAARTLGIAPDHVAIDCEDEPATCSATTPVTSGLIARWPAARDGRGGETARARADREGCAIVAFVRDALGPTEDYPSLLAVACRERAPGSADGPERSACAAPHAGINPPGRSSP